MNWSLEKWENKRIVWQSEGLILGHRFIQQNCFSLNTFKYLDGNFAG